MAQFQTTDYPTPTSFAAWNGVDNVRIEIDGMAGRKFAIDAGAVVDSSGFYDNVVLRGNSGFSGNPTIYLANGTTGAISASPDSASSSTVELALGGGSDWGTQTGYFDLVVMVETGSGTDAYVALADSGLSYTVNITGSPGIDEVSSGPGAQTCFWVELSGVTQECGVVPPVDEGDDIQNVSFPGRDAFPEIGDPSNFYRFVLNDVAGRKMRFSSVTIETDNESPFFAALEQADSQLLEFTEEGTDLGPYYLDLNGYDAYVDLAVPVGYDGTEVAFRAKLFIEDAPGSGVYIPLSASGRLNSVGGAGTGDVLVWTPVDGGA